MYVDHTGPPTWRQRAWAAVLVAWPAALSHGSAIQVLDDAEQPRADDRGTIHVAIPVDRIVTPPPGVVVHRIARWTERVQHNASPPRVRLEHAVIDEASGAADELQAVAVLSDAVGGRRTTATRLRAVLLDRRRVARRALLSSVLDDIDAGTCSTLERGYLRLVERAHGLPAADRQVRASSRGTIYRDVEYGRFKRVIELDGRMFHSSARDRDRDLDRDLDAAVEGLDTIRLGWGQVFGRPCLTAAKIAVLLRQRGWSGRVRRCPACPPRPLQTVRSQSPGGCDPPPSA